MADEQEETKTESTSETSEKESEETTEVEEQEQEQEQEEEEPKEEFSKEDKSLLQLLKNPVTRKHTLQVLAKEAGLQVASGEITKTEAKKDIVAQLKVSLGDDWAFLAEKLGPAISSIIDERVGEVREKLEEQNRQSVLRESTQATDLLYRRYTDFKNYEADIMKLMENFTPGENMSPREYLENLYFLAKAKKGQDVIAKQTAKRISRNANETQMPTGTGREDNLRSGGKKPSLDEAVRLAVSQLKKG